MKESDHIRLCLMVFTLVPLGMGCRLSLPLSNNKDGGSADVSVTNDSGQRDAAVGDDVSLLPEASLPEASLPDATILECPGSGPKDCSSGMHDDTVCFTDPAPCYRGTVVNAINSVFGSHPDWFEQGYEYSPGQFCDRILDPMQYVNEVAAIVSGQNLCVFQSRPGEIIAVKHDNSYDECYDIVANLGTEGVPCRRIGANMYCDTCAPAYE